MVACLAKVFQQGATDWTHYKNGYVHIHVNHIGKFHASS